MTQHLDGFIHSEEPILKRHSQYDLNDSLPSSYDEVERLIGNILLTTPSAFNSQPVRTVILHGPAHRRHWDLIKELLIDKIGEERYAGDTEKKIKGFHDAAGTVLFFDDEEVTQGLCDKFPSYAHNFPRWAEQAQGSHQYAAWLGLVELGFGVNLQHYTGLNDDRVREDAGVPETYRFIAEMVFGGMNSDTGKQKEKEPLSKTIKVITE